MSFTCHHCDLGFNNRILYDRHRNKCGKSATFIDETREEITIFHNSHDRWLCYCSSIKYSKANGFTIKYILLKHMKYIKFKMTRVREKDNESKTLIDRYTYYNNR